MSINFVRREPFLDEESFQWNAAYSLEKRLPALERDCTDKSLELEDRVESRWRLGHEKLAHAILLYSAGRPVELMPPWVSAAVAEYQAFAEHYAGEADTDQVDLSVQTYYVEALWLLALCGLLGFGSELTERAANVYAADPTNDGADELFELILAKLGRKSFDAEGVIHEDPYQHLLDCVKAEPEDRPALMTQFLKRWYKGQKECDWWGSHIPRKGTTVLDTGFFGYWAFEAALVTFLWDIDDSSYRDLPHYPKDLADHARKLALSAAADLPARVMGGEPCPRSGHWFTPARVGSRKHFKQGDVLPKVGGDYGATIWQWDEKQ